MDLLVQPLGKDSRIFPSLSALPPRLSAATAATAAFEQRSTLAKSSPFSHGRQDPFFSETNMGQGNTPSPRDPQNPMERWQPGRSEPSSGYHSPYTTSYPHTPSGLRPAEPGQFSTEPWSARGEAPPSSSRAAPAAGAPATDISTAQQPPLLRPIKRPPSPDYWATQPASRQRSLASPSGSWTGQVAVPQPAQILQPPEM